MLNISFLLLNSFLANIQQTKQTASGTSPCHRHIAKPANISQYPAKLVHPTAEPSEFTDPTHADPVWCTSFSAL